VTAPYYADDGVTLYHGDAATVLAAMPAGSVDCIVTSPPYYGLRDYNEPDQIGLEDTPAEYVAALVAVLEQARRVLAADGTCWLNIGDSYATRPRGSDNGWDKSRLSNPNRIQKATRASLHRTTTSDRPEKNLLGVPWRVAFALQDTGWILRNAIVWSKPNAMPESATDRFSTKHEMLFLLVKRGRYYFDLDPLREPLLTERATGHMFGGARKRLLTGSAVRRTGGTYDRPPDGGRNPGDVWKVDEELLTAQQGVLSAEDAAYMAAFIDGEGSISIRRRARQIQLMLTVVNTHEGVLRWMQERTGMGQVRQREVRDEKWRQCWEWSATSRQAAQVIYAVLDHLRVKRQQALVALRFMETTRNAGGGLAPAGYHERRHAMAEDVAALNAGRITSSAFATDPVEPRRSSAGTVWTIPTSPFPGAHFAAMPVALAERCVQAGCRPGGVVLDPFSGSGTTGLAAAKHGRRYIGIDINREYLDLSLRTRLAQTALISEAAP
jgi:DNA modification methylase